MLRTQHLYTPYFIFITTVILPRLPQKGNYSQLPSSQVSLEKSITSLKRSLPQATKDSTANVTKVQGLSSPNQKLDATFRNQT